MVSTATTFRTQLSRVTLIGERRRADIVLPSDTPIGQLLPDILQLLDDRAASRPTTRQLITSDGSALPHDATLSSAEVPDGAVLRLVRAHAAPCGAGRARRHRPGRRRSRPARLALASGRTPYRRRCGHHRVRRDRGAAGPARVRAGVGRRRTRGRHRGVPGRRCGDREDRRGQPGPGHRAVARVRRARPAHRDDRRRRLRLVRDGPAGRCRRRAGAHARAARLLFAARPWRTDRGRGGRRCGRHVGGRRPRTGPGGPDRRRDGRGLRHPARAAAAVRADGLGTHRARRQAFLGHLGEPATRSPTPSPPPTAGWPWPPSSPPRRPPRAAGC